MSTDGEADPTKELRLALVLYGGVSLAIYMHGITKELHKLVAASRALDVGGKNPFACKTTEHVYWETLSRLRDAEGVRTQVVVDVIAGTSAGGINGVYLAKGLSENRRQDELRDLWLQKGDIGKLLRGPEWVPAKPRAAVLALIALAQPKKNKPVLRGDVMARWYVEALEQMDCGGQYVEEVDTLMPADVDLELFVTATDFYGNDVAIPLASPPVVTDRRHRHVFEFHRDDGRNQFAGRPYNYALAFASRATSSFPGAFPAISFHDFEQHFHPPIELRDFDREFCRAYGLSGWSASKTYFVDGGVLNNFPFDHAIRAIREHKAFVEVDRKLLYVQPDPKEPEGRTEAEKAPGWVPTVWGGMAGLPSKEPILDDLLGVMEFNERVVAVREVIETSFEDVGDRIQKLHKKASRRDSPLADIVAKADVATLLALRSAATDDANDNVRRGYPTYVRIKIRAVVDAFARLVNSRAVCDYPDDSSHAFFVRAVISRWAEDGQLFARELPPSKTQVAFLKAFDLEYSRRQLELLIAAASWWYNPGAPVASPKRFDVVPEDVPSRKQLDDMKTLLYGRLGEIKSITTGTALDDSLKRSLRECFDVDSIRSSIEANGLDPKAFLDKRKTDLNGVRDALHAFLEGKLSKFAEELAGDLRSETKGWTPKARAAFFVRYLGFPYWDTLLFPVKFLAEAGERDAVEVVRVSPLESTLLQVRGPRVDGEPPRKLKGSAVHHFAAFFKRDFRENDYLWGRLDGAERVLRLLLEGKGHDYWDPSADAFQAILDEEKAAELKLETATDLMQDIEDQLPRVRKGPMDGSG